MISKCASVQLVHKKMYAVVYYMFDIFQSAWMRNEPFDFVIWFTKMYIKI